MLDLIADETISGKIAKDVFEIVWSEGGEPRTIVEQRGLKQVTDLSALEKIVDDIVSKNAGKVADAKANPKAIGSFVGQVMKASGGKADPQAVNDLLKKKIGISRGAVCRRRRRVRERLARSSQVETEPESARNVARAVGKRAVGANRLALMRAFCAA